MTEPAWWPTEGEEPDPRWSLANERTLLAYERTAMNLLVAGLAVAGSRSAADTPIWFAVLGLPLMLLGGIVAIGGRRRYLQAQLAMRTGQPLPRPRVTRILPYGIAAVTVGALVSGLLQLFVGGD